jgi:hypothetical protein
MFWELLRLAMLKTVRHKGRPTQLGDAQTLGSAPGEGGAGIFSNEESHELHINSEKRIFVIKLGSTL